MTDWPKINPSKADQDFIETLDAVNDMFYNKAHKMTRLEANRKILEILKVMVETYPDQRFGQMMRNVDVVREVKIDTKEFTGLVWIDEFNLESEELLNRIKNSPLVKG